LGNDDRIKIKLSEISDIYDIEDDVSVDKKDEKKEEADEPSYEATIKYYDKKLEDEFDGG